MKWIKMMNKMFKVATINIDDGLTEYGLMWAVMVKVRAMYN